MRWNQVGVGSLLAAGCGWWAISGAALAETTHPASPVAAITATETYRQGFLDGYRARALSDRRHVDRPYPRWRDRRSARPRDSGPYWRNRPRLWIPPDVYAERRFRPDGAHRGRSLAKPGVIEAASNGEQKFRSAE